jgi:hypothetical protein
MSTRLEPRNLVKAIWFDQKVALSVRTGALKANAGRLPLTHLDRIAAGPGAWPGRPGPRCRRSRT